MSPALPQQALASAFDWTWKTSLEATVLIVLVLLFQFTFAKILSPRWRYGLGLLILLRLVLPAAPASPLSIFNLGNHHPQQAEIDTAPPAIHPFVPPVFWLRPRLTFPRHCPFSQFQRRLRSKSALAKSCHGCGSPALRSCWGG